MAGRRKLQTKNEEDSAPKAKRARTTLYGCYGRVPTDGTGISVGTVDLIAYVNNDQIDICNKVYRSNTDARSIKSVAASDGTLANGHNRVPQAYHVPSLYLPPDQREFGFVLAMGQNDVGQLGLDENVECRKKPAVIPGLDDVVSIACGGMHTVCLHKTGEVSTYGCNDAGALGRLTPEESEQFAPGKVDLPGKAIQVSAGDSHSAALLEDGRVYAWGSFRDNSDQMGLFSAGKVERTPVQVLPGKEMCKVSSGDDHLAILVSDGTIFTCGNPDSGQLGRLSRRTATRDTRRGMEALLVPDKVDVHPHKRASSRVRCSEIWTGGYCTFAKDSNTGDVYVFGLNNYGQIGVEDEEPQFHPVAAKGFLEKKWKQIAGGMHHTLGLDEDGKVYSLGRHHDGRLGLGANCDATSKPTIIPVLQNEKCVQVACGSTVSFAVTEDGRLFSWGFGENLQLGVGSEDDKVEPVEVPLPDRKVLAVASGGQHTVLIAKQR